jgi:hypothetical protein
MPFKKGQPVSFEINKEGINEIIDEKNNVALMLREVAWNGREKHLELRKWIIDVDKEQPMKGVSFITPEGPSNLVDALVKNGYGETKNVLHELSSRDDFNDALVQTVGKKKVEKAKNTTVVVNEDEYYDPKEVIN